MTNKWHVVIILLFMCQPVKQKYFFGRNIITVICRKLNCFQAGFLSNIHTNFCYVMESFSNYTFLPIKFKLTGFFESCVALWNIFEIFCWTIWAINYQHPMLGLSESAEIEIFLGILSWLHIKIPKSHLLK